MEEEGAKKHHEADDAMLETHAGNVRNTVLLVLLVS